MKESYLKQYGAFTAGGQISELYQAQRDPGSLLKIKVKNKGEYFRYFLIRGLAYKEDCVILSKHVTVQQAC